MSDLSNEEVYRAVGAIVRQYSLFGCADCAKAVLKWLRANGIPGTVLKLRTRFRESHILSTRKLNEGFGDSITDNGVHYGVEVRGLVFDNLSSEGMTREQWLLDFSCPSQQFSLQELDRL
ncbi:MAG: hypothetical protein HC780_28435 [Leptolyngbyaceae cyanobacterium CSU_1_3]|nr:hypothetical protein [Leptolyngbyaceae cyanobacterium CSU_1_3]